MATVAIVNDVSLDVRHGELLGIVGASGSGKSSFLRLLNRLDEPTSGTVFLDGQDYRQLPPRELRRRVGMVTQRPFLFPGDVASNLRFGPLQRGETLPDGEVSALLERVGLPGFATRDVINLSGGEQQRVSLARALANRPRCLLLDEPTSALDERCEARHRATYLQSGSANIAHLRPGDARPRSGAPNVRSRRDPGNRTPHANRNSRGGAACLSRSSTPKFRSALRRPPSLPLLALLVILLARRRNIHLESDTAIALLRGIVQIVAVGSILMLLLKGPRWTSVFLLTGMIIAAGSISARRAKNIPGALKVSTYSIAAGAGLVTAIMTWAGVIDTAITTLIPVGSMIIANAMNTNGLALNRFRSEVLSHAGEIETALALGAAPPETVARYAESSIHASLIPAIDNLRSLGIVWIPGLMTGMLLSGSEPALCGHLPVRGDRHDPGFVGAHFPAEHDDDPQSRLLVSRAVAPEGKQLALIFRSATVPIKIHAESRLQARTASACLARREAYSGNASASSSTSRRMRDSTFLSVRLCSASEIHLPTCRISGSLIPRVVSAGDPMRMPLGFIGGLVSNGNRVLVHRDAGLVQRVFGFAAQHALGKDVDQHQVGIGSAGNNVEALVGQRLRQHLGVGHNLPRVILEAGLHGFVEAHRLGRNDVHQRTALHSRKHNLVDRRRILGLGEDQPGTRAAQRLVRGGGDNLRVRHRRRMRPARHQSGKVRHVHQVERANLVGNLPHARRSR